MEKERLISSLLFHNVENNTFGNFLNSDLSFFGITNDEFMSNVVYVQEKLNSLNFSEFEFSSKDPWFKDKKADFNELYEKYLEERYAPKSKEIREITGILLHNELSNQNKESLLKRGLTEEEIKKYHISSVSKLDESIKQKINAKVNIFTRTLAKTNEYLDGVIFPCIYDAEIFNVIIRNLDEKTIPYIKFSNCCPPAVFFNIYHLYHEQEVYLCEGVFDAIALERLGYNAVAFSAGCPYLEQLALLLSICKGQVKLKLMFDNDSVGRKISFIIKNLYENSEEVSYEGKDPWEMNSNFIKNKK